MNKCMIKGCDRKYDSNGFCKSHRAKHFRNIRRIYAFNYLGNKCNKCGIKNVKLEFDHINKNNCNFRIAVGLEFGLDKLNEELDKCQLLCRNCHMDKTLSESDRHRTTHGELGMYTNYGCRCVECKKVWNAYNKIYHRALRLHRKVLV